MKKASISIVIFSAAFVASVPLSAYALLAESSKQPTGDNTSEGRGVVQSVRDTVIPKEVQEKQRENEARIQAKKNAITEKLAGKRAQLCEQKESQINTMMDERAAAAERHYQTFKNIRLQLDQFAVEKQLAVDAEGIYKNLLSISETELEGDIKSIKKLTFRCEDSDASAPGKILADEFAELKADLKAYRDSVKDYAQEIKTSAQSPTAQPETEEETSNE